MEALTRWSVLANSHTTPETFGQALRRLRESRGWSLRRLAQETTFNYSHLAHVEKGRAAGSTQLAERCDTALAAGGALIAAHDGVLPPSRTDGLEFAMSWQRGAEDAAGLWRSDATGDTDLRAAVFLPHAFVTPAMRWLTSPLDDRPAGTGNQPVDEADIDSVRQVTATFRRLDNQHGGGHVRGSVVRYLDQEVTPLIRNGRYGYAVGRALYAAVAELAQLAGWASYDAGLHGIAQRYLIQALRLAAIAGDRPLGTEILAAMSHQTAYLRYASEAVDLARAAGRSAADAGVLALSAETAVVEAHGLALAGDEQACASALDRAEHTLDRAERRDDPQWIGYFDEAYLAARFGHCFAALGRGDLAQRFARRSLDMDTRYRRGQQFNVALLAVAYAQAGDIDEAAAVGKQALEMGKHLRSARSTDYVRAVAERLAPHVGLPSVAQFMNQVRPAPTG